MLNDLKFTLRSLLKTPGFTVIVLLTLGLGIGATAAIFSVVNAILLTPLPYADPQRLVQIYTEFPTAPNGGVERFAASTAEYFDVRRETTSWDSVNAWTTSGVNIATAAEPARISAAFVTGELMPSLGAAAALGRIVLPEDDDSRAPLVAVISYGLWQRAFSGTEAVLGRDILIDGTKHKIIGVMPPAFRFPIGAADSPDLWAPMRLDPLSANNNDHSVLLLGRLKAGVTLQQARAELDALVRHQAQTQSGHHLDPKEHPLTAYAVTDEVVRAVRPALRVLLGASCFLLLIAAMNIASLLLVRAEIRQREIAVRSALGAGLWRLAWEFAAEGALLSLLGSALGLLLASYGLRVVKLAVVAGVPGAERAGIDAHVVLFVVVLGLLTGLVFGLAPLIHIAKGELQGTLKSVAASTTATLGAQRFRQALVVSQIALALVLLTGTGLMLRATWKLQQVNAGIDPTDVTTLSVALPSNLYPEEASKTFWTTLQQRLLAVPGIESAALASGLPPVAYQGIGYGIEIEGYVPRKGGPLGTMDLGGGKLQPFIDRIQVMTPGYFESLKIHLVAGRFFDRRDGAQVPRVAVVNRTTAQGLWGSGESALGHHMRPNGWGDWYTIVGVIADVKNSGLDNPTGTEIDLPYTQAPAGSSFVHNLYIVVRSPLATSSVVQAVRREVANIDAALPIDKVSTMDEVLLTSQARPHLLMQLLCVFAGVALVLAAVGIYGVISYSVARRTKEFGIRTALGAQYRVVLGLVLRRGLVLTVSGVLIGVAGALALTRLLSGFLFGITPTDPATFASVALLLSLVALGASYVPARRAAKVDPLVALRVE